jgi:hypothetical protein
MNSLKHVLASVGLSLLVIIPSFEARGETAYLTCEQDQSPFRDISTIIIDYDRRTVVYIGQKSSAEITEQFVTWQAPNGVSLRVNRISGALEMFASGRWSGDWFCRRVPRL